MTQETNKQATTRTRTFFRFGFLAFVLVLLAVANIEIVGRSGGRDAGSDAERQSGIVTAQDYFDTLEDRFDFGAAEGLTAIFQFELSGDNGGTYCVHVNNGEMSVSDGPDENPSFVLKMSADDYIEMAHGDLNGVTAFIFGKLRYSGDSSLASKMKEIFPLIED